MGLDCYAVTKEKSEANILVFNNSINEFEYSSRGTTQRIRTIPINKSKERIFIEIKPLLSTDKENPPDETEVSRRVLLNSVSSVPRYPTNFKIEPFHFRRERRKESLDDRYTVCEFIGEGSFGIVKKIKDIFIT